MRFWLAKLIATFFYTGLSPKMPGTVGSIAAALLFIPVLHSTSFAEKGYILYATLLLGCLATEIYIRTVVKLDPREVVIDEVFAVWLLIAINYEVFPGLAPWIICVVSCALFRVFDIMKPFPINIVDKNVHGTLGIMLDDVMAAGMAFAVFWVIFKFAI